MRSQAEERRFQFHYGPHHEVGELVLRMSPWVHQPVGTVEVSSSGAWSRITGRLVPGPDSTISKEILRAAEHETGLTLAFRAVPWKAEGERMVRQLVVSGSHARVLELFPPGTKQ